MNRLIAWFSDNPIAANLMMLAIMLGGFMSLPQINKEFFPSSDPSTIEVSIPYPGAAPVNVEQQICIRVEQAVEDLEGIKKLTSQAQQNLCRVLVKADDNYDLQTLLNDVTMRVDAISTLPDDAERPQVSLWQMKHQMMEIALFGDVDEDVLKRYAEKLKTEMEALAHVSSIAFSGVRDYEISIELKSDTLRQYQMTLTEVEQAIRNSSLDLPGGKIRSGQGDILIQTRNQAYQRDDFANIIIRRTQSGAIIRLGDIATIEDAFIEDATIARFNGYPSVFLKVQVSGDPDVLKTNASVMAFLDKRKASLPSSLSLTVWHDFSISFKDRIRTLVSNGVGGLILVFLVLMLFLRPLLALWVSIGIGVAFLGALWLMPVVGASLNMISLFAFLLILGIIVDDAIIVGESVYTEQQKHGTGVATAKQGTQRVSKPIVFAVASTMIVFVPMLFLPGPSAHAATMIPKVVLLCLFFSLLESLFILPSHLAEMPPEGHFKGPIARNFDKVRHWFSNGLDHLIRKVYAPLLAFALRYYAASIASFFAMLAIVLSIAIGGWMQFGFFPNVTTDYIQIKVELADGEPFTLHERLSKKIGNSARELQDALIFEGTNVSYIKNYSVWKSGNEVRAALGLNRDYEASLSSPDIIKLWREKMGNIKEAESVEYFYQIDDGGKPLQYVLAAEDNQQLAEASRMLQEYLLSFNGVFNISDSLSAARSEIELDIKSSSEFTAWDMQLMGQQLRNAFYGTEVQRVPRDGEDIRVMLRLDSGERSQHESINSLPVRDNNNNIVRLDAISAISYKPALQDIKRINGRRTVIVAAELLEGTHDPMEISNQVLGEFSETLKKQYPDVSVNLEGKEEERRDFMSAWASLGTQALIAIFAMMAIAFRSYWQPIIILTAIPFGTMGAILGHLIMGREVSIFSFLGLMACAGVVVNDNLVLLDRINQLCATGMKRVEAIHQAGIDRFRPIILTSVTTFIGLMPIMSETSLQAQFLIPMVISLAFGVLFATGITLVLVPCLYLLGEEVKAGGSNAIYKLRNLVRR